MPRRGPGPRASTPAPAASRTRPLRATRSEGATLKARAISRRPGGVGLVAMKSRISSRLGKPRCRRRGALADALSRRFRGPLAVLSWRRPPWHGSSILSFWTWPCAWARPWSLSRFPARAWPRSRRCSWPWFRSWPGPCARLWRLAPEQLDGALEGHFLGLEVARQGRVDAAMADIGTIAAADRA